MDKTTPMPPEFFKPRYEWYWFINIKKKPQKQHQKTVYFSLSIASSPGDQNTPSPHNKGAPTLYAITEVTPFSGVAFRQYDSYGDENYPSF